MEAPPFSLPVAVRWADLDPNGHVRHSVYYDWGATVRITYLDQLGFGLPWMTRNGIGPILFREEARFMRELRLGDQLVMDVALAGSSADARKWKMRHRIGRGAEQVAIIEVDGAWLDLRARKIVAPPEDLVRAFEGVARTEDFAVIASSKAPK
jgi:acyl-CoA thioester hydrolase